MKKLNLKDGGFVYVNDNDPRLNANNEEKPQTNDETEEALLPQDIEKGKSDNQFSEAEFRNLHEAAEKNELLLPAEFNEPFERKVADTTEKLMPNTEE
jgi:hypothetical protein